MPLSIVTPHPLLLLNLRLQFLVLLVLSLCVAKIGLPNFLLSLKILTPLPHVTLIVSAKNEPSYLQILGFIFAEMCIFSTKKILCTWKATKGN